MTNRLKTILVVAVALSLTAITGVVLLDQSVYGMHTSGNTNNSTTKEGPTVSPEPPTTDIDESPRDPFIPDPLTRSGRDVFVPPPKPLPEEKTRVTIHKIFEPTVCSIDPISGFNIGWCPNRPQGVIDFAFIDDNLIKENTIYLGGTWRASPTNSTDNSQTSHQMNGFEIITYDGIIGGDKHSVLHIFGDALVPPPDAILSIAWSTLL